LRHELPIDKGSYLPLASVAEPELPAYEPQGAILMKPIFQLTAVSFHVSMAWRAADHYGRNDGDLAEKIP
jgi:hypothetical protein